MYSIGLLCYPIAHTKEFDRLLKFVFGIQTTEDNVHAAQVADVIVLAVKPQLMAEVCQAMLAGAPEIHEKLFVTVAAGLPVSRYREWLGDIRIVRAMPNTPALLGMGMTAFAAAGSLP